ncbi:SMC-Scp complex subunit ScpB [Microbulbifer harenosus]|uniref:SMC-Scp complex subunit ScpB n=1 Tax=Microbulbifer harenosus TaxID=2576840 RepID=A0ABY2UGY9_9GAMM|nr:SMC-Scp complex subunit ScpB [Microbulbifer harenosus]TLM76207.1 SMC-Scp complex subunit ScpB [Microbulbifer harenosus]
MSITPELLSRILEGALLAAAQPMSEDRLLALFEEGEQPERGQLREALEQIAQRCEGRGFELRQVASGWRFQVPEDLAPWVNKLWEEKPQRYSRATLETLAIIAYRQPITRGDIEEIRGVAVSSQIVRSLADRGWIKVVGQRDVPGKPSLYATTREFLDYFNLKSLDDLPTLAEIRDIDSLNAVLDLGVDATGTDDDEPAADAAGEDAQAGADTRSSESEDEQLEEGLQEAGSDQQTLETAPEETELADETGAAVELASESYAEEALTPETEAGNDDAEPQSNADEADHETGADEPVTPDHPTAEALDEDDNKSPENLNS